MGCIVSKRFWDFYIFFIFTRPLSGDFEVHTTISRITRFAKNVGPVNVGSVARRLTGCLLRGISLMEVGSVNGGGLSVRKCAQRK